jgi:hypothetical protein
MQASAIRRRSGQIHRAGELSQLIEGLIDERVGGLLCLMHRKHPQPDHLALVVRAPGSAALCGEVGLCGVQGMLPRRLAGKMTNVFGDIHPEPCISRVRALVRVTHSTPHS